MLISPISHEDGNQTRKDVQDVLKTNMSLKVNKIMHTIKGAVKVECNTIEMCNKIAQSLDKAKYTVKVPTVLKSRFKIVHVDKENDLGDNVVENLKMLNELQLDSSLELLKKYFNLKTKTWTLVVEMDPKSARKFLYTGYCYLGDQRCRIFEYIPIRSCGSCLKLNHNSTECNNRDRKCCLKCGSFDHQIKDCNALVPKCVNCTARNREFNLDLNTEHFSTASNCPCRVAIINSIRRRIAVK